MAASNDSRTSSRARILKAGKIIVTGGWGSHECVIKNVSKTGAKVEVDPVFEFPSQFQLLIIKDETLVPCKLAWRQGKTAGLRFIGEHKHIDLKDYRY
jgi:PilZ domain-containing protein